MPEPVPPPRQRDWIGLEAKAGGVRLQKYMAHVGVASRRKCEELIRQGKVKVNGQTAVLGQTIQPDNDDILVCDQPLGPPRGRVYLMLNKPPGFITTVDDPQGRATVMDLLPRNDSRLYPVGRLDRDTTGLLLFTNDGPLAQELLHPSRGVAKLYRARVEGRPGDGALKRIEEGIELDDGMTAPCQVRRCPGGWLELELKQGRKRQVRRMLAAVGHPVIELQRVRFGPLELRGLEPGSYRPLSPAEISSLRGAVKGKRQ